MQPALDMLGAADASEPLVVTVRGQTVVLTAGTLSALAGLLAWRKHPVLGLLDGFAVGSNAARVYTKQISVRRAAENLGSHVVATAASLALPKYPAIGYLSGVMASNLVLRREGEGWLQRLDDTALGGEPQVALVRASELEPPPAAAPRPPRPAWQVALGGLVLVVAGAGVYSAVTRST